MGSYSNFRKGKFCGLQIQYQLCGVEIREPVIVPEQTELRNWLTEMQSESYTSTCDWLFITKSSLKVNSVISSTWQYQMVQQ